ncbi:MAG: cobalt ECF transporter T component CbiQ [Anaerovorax sp.]|nr:cobalt ECF transporter T component CbiQ [Anaerovorax sp.]
MMIIDKLAYSSQLRNKSPFLKSAFAVGTLLICVGARSFVVSGIVLILMGCLTVFYSRTSLSHYIKLMTAPFAFLALGTIAIAVNYTTAPMDLISIPIGLHYLAVSVTSLTYAIRLIVVSLASISCLYFLTLTTPLLDLLAVLRRLHCPWIIIELMMLIYRYIFVLLDMALAITTAQNCRLGNRDAKTAIQAMGLMLSVLLVRALNKSSLLFDAMESRCYDGEIRVLNESNPSSMKEKAGVILFLVALLVVSVVCKSNGGI